MKSNKGSFLSFSPLPSFPRKMRNEEELREKRYLISPSGEGRMEWRCRNLSEATHKHKKEVGEANKKLFSSALALLSRKSRNRVFYTDDRKIAFVVGRKAKKERTRLTLCRKAALSSSASQKVSRAAFPRTERKGEAAIRLIGLHLFGNSCCRRCPLVLPLVP